MHMFCPIICASLETWLTCIRILSMFYFVLVFRGGGVINGFINARKWLNSLCLFTTYVIKASTKLWSLKLVHPYNNLSLCTLEEIILIHLSCDGQFVFIISPFIIFTTYVFIKRQLRFWIFEASYILQTYSIIIDIILIYRK